MRTSAVGQPAPRSAARPATASPPATPNALQHRARGRSALVVSSTLSDTVSSSTRHRLMPRPPRPRDDLVGPAGHPDRDGVEERAGGDVDAAVAQGVAQRAGVTRARAGRSRRRPAGPCHTAYMLAITASSTWAVQMLEVAFSRRMCCSRVCRARR